MCTLTFIPNHHQFIFTSSRDEKASRNTISPEKYWLEDQWIYYAKDAEKGGTWLAFSKNLLTCLLNGADETIISNEVFPKSRGNIVLERFLHQNNKDFLEKTSFDGVSPFTLVIFDIENHENTLEIIWNNKEIKIGNVDFSQPRIWSSSTLYDTEMKKNREGWFQEFLQENPQKSPEKIWEFHHKKHSDFSHQNILMKRNDGKQTTSISQIVIENEKFQYQYHDVLNQKTNSITWGKEMDLQLL